MKKQLLLPLLIVCLYSVGEKHEEFNYRQATLYLKNEPNTYIECEKLLGGSMLLDVSTAQEFNNLKIGQIIKYRVEIIK